MVGPGCLRAPEDEDDMSVKLYAIALPVFFAIDMVWLGGWRRASTASRSAH